MGGSAAEVLAQLRLPLLVGRPASLGPMLAAFGPAPLTVLLQGWTFTIDDGMFLGSTFSLKPDPASKVLVQDQSMLSAKTQESCTSDTPAGVDTETDIVLAS